MSSWPELVKEIESRLQVLSKSEDQISVSFSWDDGRTQQVMINRIDFIGENLALVTSPVVGYSASAADMVLNNYGIPIVKNDADGTISISHPLHVDHMPASVCLQAISSLAETADEIEKVLLNGGDAQNGAIAAGGNDAGNTGDDSVIPSGQYIVGQEVAPGFYRFAGYVARLDSSMSVIDNASARSGLGLINVFEHDNYFEVSGEAIRVEDFPVYDVMENAPRGGIYLVGVDIAPGRYRINGDGSLAYYATYDRQMNLLENDSNRGSAIANIAPSVFAFEFRGRIEAI
jgi:hypothetical protein